MKFKKAINETHSSKTSSSDVAGIPKRVPKKKNKDYDSIVRRKVGVFREKI